MITPLSANQRSGIHYSKMADKCIVLEELKRIFTNCKWWRFWVDLNSFGIFVEDSWESIQQKNSREFPALFKIEYESTWYRKTLLDFNVGITCHVAPLRLGTKISPAGVSIQSSDQTGGVSNRLHESLLAFSATKVLQIGAGFTWSFKEFF